MKRLFFFTSLIIVFSVQSLFALTGREVIDKTEKLVKPSSTKSKVTMNIYKGSSVMNKEFLLFQKTIDGEDKVLITFTKPTQIKVLTHTHKKGEDDQWLSLSSGKVKRLVGGDKTQSFVQSHMTYEDLESRDVNNYDYNLLKDAQVNGDACYMVEAIKKAGSKTYDKNILAVRKADNCVVKIEFYRKGALIKTLENKNIQKIDGIVTPFNVVVTMANGEGKTELIIDKVIYNKDIEDSKFSKDALR